MTNISSRLSFLKNSKAVLYQRNIPKPVFLVKTAVKQLSKIGDVSLIHHQHHQISSLLYLPPQSPNEHVIQFSGTTQTWQGSWYPIQDISTRVRLQIDSESILLNHTCGKQRNIILTCFSFSYKKKSFKQQRK